MSLVLLSTGGTGGHIYPAVALARELTAMGLGAGLQVAFIGQQGGMEARLVSAEGFPFYGVRAGKWHRGRPDPREALQAALGLRDALKIVRHLRPALVLGFGGFASFPGLAAARTLGVPYALHEQNAYPGLVTRWFARGARFIGTAQSEVAAHLPTSVRPRLRSVGMPVREVRVEKTEARRRLGLPETGRVTLVLGGSQGSLVLNRAVPEAFSRLGEAYQQGHTVLHSTGAAHLESVTESLRGQLEAANYHLRPYLDTVLAWSAADLGVTRAGTGTLAEAAFYGVPLVMVPLPSAAENHQLYNAQAVAAGGAGTVVEQTQLNNPDALVAAWRGFLGPDTLRRAASAARARSPEGAAARLGGLVMTELNASETAARLLTDGSRALPLKRRTAPPQHPKEKQETP